MDKTGPKNDHYSDVHCVEENFVRSECIDFQFNKEATDLIMMASFAQPIGDHYEEVSLN